MRFPWIRAVGPALVLAGLVVLGCALARGLARLYLVVIIPVLTSSSPWVFLGALLIIAGVFLLPWTFSSGWELAPLEGPAAPVPAETEAGAGGFLLIGPLPIFFGSWRHPTRRVYLLAVLAGSVALALLVVVLLVVL